MIRSPRILLALLLSWGAVARADGDAPPRCHLERIDPTPLADDRLTLYATDVQLDGTPVDPSPPFSLKIDGKQVGRSEKNVPFRSTGEDVYVAIVVEEAAQYKKVFEQVQGALTDFLNGNSAIRVTLVPFGSDLPPVKPFLKAPAAAPDVDALSVEDDSGDVRMVDAIRLALGALNKVQPKTVGGVPPRRLIVVISDGLNARMDRATFRKLGDEAKKDGIPIHTIAFSPIDERGPLLNLGELSKRTFGTFRWAKKAENVGEQLSNLGVEIQQQRVLTFKVPISSTEKHSFQLQCGEVVSNKLGAPKDVIIPGHRWWFWVLVGLGGLVGLYLVLAIAYAVARRRSSGEPKPAKVKAPKPVKVKPQAQPVAAAGGARAAPSRQATLIGVSGPIAGQRFPVAGRITIGKGPGHAITVVGDGAVSTNHCELRVDGAGFVLRDLGSTNGTYVNGRRVTEHRLQDGDLVRLGMETQLKFRVG